MSEILVPKTVWNGWTKDNPRPKRVNSSERERLLRQVKRRIVQASDNQELLRLLSQEREQIKKLPSKCDVCGGPTSGKFLCGLHWVDTQRKKRSNNAGRKLNIKGSLKAFILHIRTGSTSAAARELGLSDSGVNCRISVLKEYLGIRTFAQLGAWAALNGYIRVDDLPNLKPHTTLHTHPSDRL